MTPNRSPNGSATPSNRLSNGRNNGSTSSAGARTPVRNVLLRNSPRSASISEMTSPPRNLASQSSTGDTPSTGLHVDPVQFEEEYDRSRYAENAGDPDSEDEGDGPANVTALRGVCTDRNEHQEENFAAVVHESEYIESNPKPDITADVDIPGAPLGWSRPSAPDKWNPPKPKADKGEPAHFDLVDNPGDWMPYTYQAKHSKTAGKDGKTYLHHCLPTGATPVPKDRQSGKRSVDGWQFHYKGWVNNDETLPIYRSGATRENLFPDSRKGSLDADKLQALGLTADRMQEQDGAPDSLFFYQLLLPICDTTKSGVADDPRKGFYHHVSRCSNLYAMGELELSNGYGHDYTPTNPPELLRWDGVVTMDGVRGGSGGAIMRRFDASREDNTSFCPYIYESFTKTRWLEIKRVMKLCNNQAAPKRGQDGYNPAYKYDFIYDCIVHNTNALTKYAGLDLAGDESSWGHNGHGEPDSGLVSLILNKPHITKGGQVVMVSDVDRIRIRSYLHRHQLHEKVFSIAGQNEVRMILDDLLPKCIGYGEPNLNNPLVPSGIFRDLPHITWDNYFSGDKIMEYAAVEGFGLTMTCRRDRLPSRVPGKYLHKEKTSTTARSKAARFENPIVLTKRINEESNLVFTSFQSTSSCNISSINALNGCRLYASTKERGRGSQKRQWAIEMNEARQLYLKTYGAIDRLDHLIQNCNLCYRSWKYWHSAMLHAKGMAIVTAYDMYLECCEGKLAVQMLQYSPKDRKYAGDENFRVATKQPVIRRKMTPKKSPQKQKSDSVVSSSSGLTVQDLRDASGRLCGRLNTLCLHMESVQRLPSNRSRVCVVCGKDAAHICTKCDKVMHFRPARKQEENTIPCFIHYHNTSFFGLARDDWELLGIKKNDWVFPDKDTQHKHALEMRELQVEALADHTNRPPKRPRLLVPTRMDRPSTIADSSNNNNNNNNNNAAIEDAIANDPYILRGEPNENCI